MAALSFTIFNSYNELPPEWNSIAGSNIFLSKNMLAVLQKAPPEKMECYPVGLFKNQELTGIALLQYIDLHNVKTFKEEKATFCLKDYLFKTFASKVLIAGNNTITGQNAYTFTDKITESEGLQLLQQALIALKKRYDKKGERINLLSVKDFTAAELPDFKSVGYKNYYQFCTQPNMILYVRDNWQCIENYITDLNPKYRKQYNRARKKGSELIKTELDATAIKRHEKEIHELYITVANKASFNTFYLPENHFEVLKNELNDNFHFYGYYLNDKMVGFSTLIRNGNEIASYFLGYDDTIQKDKMLYLNMLYDMADYGIKYGFKQVVFARSAMEIKSSVGAEAIETYGIIKHTNPLINIFTGKLFRYFEPEITWKKRSPFK